MGMKLPEIVAEPATDYHLIAFDENRVKYWDMKLSYIVPI
jgi:hypothetical protein